MCLLNVRTKNHVINNVDMCFQFFFLFGIITISLICLSMFLYRTNKSCNSILHVVCIFNYCIVIVNISHDEVKEGFMNIQDK